MRRIYVSNTSFKENTVHQYSRLRAYYSSRLSDVGIEAFTGGPMRRILFVSAILLLAACGAGAQQIATDQCTFLNSAQAAFCDAFETIHAGGRAGDLDPTKWAFYRISSNNIPFHGNVLTFYPTTAMFCEELKDAVVPDRDSFVCGEQFGRPNYWLTALNDAGAQAWLGPRALQPFDFAGRTGTVEWNVDAKTAGSHTYWTEFWIADEPAPAAHSSNGAGRGFMPRNGIGINFGGL